MYRSNQSSFSLTQITVASVVAILWLIVMTGTADAIPPFVKVFQEKYKGSDAFNEAVTSAKCNLCHVDGKGKTIRNSYGEELSKLLDHKELKPMFEAEAEKATGIVVEAMDKVAAIKKGGDDSPSYGELIATNLLPGVEHDAEALAAGDEEKPAEAPAATGPANQLLDAFVKQLADDLKAELSEELREQLKAEILKEITSTMPEAVRAGIKAERELEIAAARKEKEKVVIEKIHELGGTVRDIAMDDDRKEVAFHLSGTELTDEGLLHVKDVSEVIHLQLRGTKITDAGLAHLSGMDSLVKLHLEKTAITDAGLAHLKGLEGLEYLNVYGTGVTDAATEYLKEIPNLKKLYIWQTKVTLPGFEKMQAALPDTEIIPDLVKEKQRAEEEAIRKEEEAKKKAEEEKKKAEEEAKKKAEEEAKKKAEEEAKKKAEEEAKKKAEEEAKKKAEEEAKKKEEEATDQSDDEAEKPEEEANQDQEEG